MLKNLTDLVTLILLLAPVTIQLARTLAQHTHNKKMQNLIERANVIVTALERSGMDSSEKKELAYNSLSNYAKEVGIKVTPEQVSQYIESAVTMIKAANNSLTALTPAQVSGTETVKYAAPITDVPGVQLKQAPDSLGKTYEAQSLGGDPNASKEAK